MLALSLALAALCGMGAGGFYRGPGKPAPARVDGTHFLQFGRCGRGVGRRGGAGPGAAGGSGPVVGRGRRFFRRSHHVHALQRLCDGVHGHHIPHLRYGCGHTGALRAEPGGNPVSGPRHRHPGGGAGKRSGCQGKANRRQNRPHGIGCRPGGGGGVCHGSLFYRHRPGQRRRSPIGPPCSCGFPLGRSWVCCFYCCGLLCASALFTYRALRLWGRWTPWPACVLPWPPRWGF